MVKISYRSFFAVMLLALLLLNPASCVIFQRLMNPIKWIRENVIRKPLDKGAVVRAFVDPFPAQRVLTDAQYFKAADKYIPGPTVDSFTKQQVGTSFLTDKQGVQKANLAFLLSESLPNRVAFDQKKLSEYNVTASPAIPVPDVILPLDDGKAINLDKVLSPNFVTELKAASLENLLDPMIKESEKNRGEDGLTESDAQLDQMLLERFGNLKEGEHVYDGSNLILNLPASSDGVKTTTDSKRTEPKVAYIDLSDLKPLLTNRVLTVFTGLGSYTVPLGYEEMIPNGTNYIPTSSGDAEASVSNDAFHDKLSTAGNQVETYLPPKMMTLYPRPEDVETNNQATEDITNQFVKMGTTSVNRSPKESNLIQTLEGVLSVRDAPERLDETPATNVKITDNPVRQLLSPVYKPTTAPQVIHPYDFHVPQPVYSQSEGDNAEVSNNATANDDVKHHIFHEQVLGLQTVQNTTLKNSTLSDKTEADIEKLQNAIVSRIHGGLEGYFQHVKDNHDDENCMSLMVCEMSASPLSYGAFGNNTARYFRESAFSTENLASNYFKRVSSMAEEHKDLQKCRSSYKECLLSSAQLAELGRGLMFDIVLD